MVFLPNASLRCAIHRLSGLYKDLAALATDHANFSSGGQKERERRRHARAQAGEFLLHQMAAAGEEAR